MFRAVDQATGATVAIKVLRDVSDSSVAWHRTRRELAALETLTGHPNVIRPIDLLELADGPALVMEYAPGGSVADLLDDQPSPSRRRLTVDQTRVRRAPDGRRADRGPCARGSCTATSSRRTC